MVIILADLLFKILLLTRFKNNITDLDIPETKKGLL